MPRIRFQRSSAARADEFAAAKAQNQIFLCLFLPDLARCFMLTPFQTSRLLSPGLKECIWIAVLRHKVVRGGPLKKPCSEFASRLSIQFGSVISWTFSIATVVLTWICFDCRGLIFVTHGSLKAYPLHRRTPTYYIRQGGGHVLRRELDRQRPCMHQPVWLDGIRC